MKAAATRHPSTPEAHAGWRGTALCAAALWAAAGAAGAQEAGGSASGAGGGKPSHSLDLRVGLTQTFTNNDDLAATDRKSGHSTQISPGLRWVGNGARVRGFVDYALVGNYGSEGKTSSSNGTNDRLRHQLNGNLAVSLLDDRAFLDASGVVSQQPVSAFGPVSPVRPNGPNLSETSSFRLSPYYRAPLGGGLDLQARYTYQTNRTQTQSRLDSDSNTWSLNLGNRGTGAMLTWSLQAQQQAVKYSGGRNVDRDDVSGTLFYALSPQWQLSATGGRESNNELALDKRSYSNTGLGADWRLSDRTRVSLALDKRYFGNGHRLSLEHRAAQTFVRFTDTRGVSENGLGQGGKASLGTLYDWLDASLTALEPDPVRRAQLVQAELLRRGLSGELPVVQDFLASTSTLQRRQELAVGLLGRRQTVTFTLTRGHSQRLLSSPIAGDDFDTEGGISQQGWSLAWAHRLTPLTNLSLTLSRQETQGDTTGQSSTQNSLGLGLGTRLSARTTGNLQLRRTLADSTTKPYAETAVVGNLNHIF